MLKASKILFITLSNIGDVILTLPALDALRERFPEAKFTVMVGPRPKEIFANSPFIDKLIVYDKHASLKDKIRLFMQLRGERFDAVVDLRNTFFGAFLPARYRTSAFRMSPRGMMHMKDKHLYRMQSAKLKAPEAIPSDAKKKSLYISRQDDEYVRGILRKNNIKEQEKIVVLAPGARSHAKRWAGEKFATLAQLLMKEFKALVVLAGDRGDISINKYIGECCQNQVLDLSATVSIAQLGALLKMARLLITNDSAVSHLGSYLNTPTIAVFGPTEDLKYGPWSEAKATVKKDIFCRPCAKAECRFGTLDCLRLIKVEDVLRQARNLYFRGHETAVFSTQVELARSSIAFQKPLASVQGASLSGAVRATPSACRQARYTVPEDFKRILIVRTDRIGDVLLSTPVIRALRDAYPAAYIAMVVAPAARDIVDGNPYSDEVFVYDKNARHKSWIESLWFALMLKQKKFDLALILHPANRAHLVTFFAGIPKRIGYNRKMGFLLTDRLSHTKQLGEKHEVEYSLDMVRYLGIEPKDENLFMPISPESEVWAEEALRKEGVRQADSLLAVHPGASCPSKIWPGERFAEVADRLAQKYGFKILIICGPRDINAAQNVIKNLRHGAINLAGKTTVSQLASVFKRCRLVISNDSGPVHVASGVGVPVISIFGRNQKGLSPKRWGPRGGKDRILHKEVGCIECLAHDCRKDFLCLKAISVDELIKAADLILTQDTLSGRSLSR